MKHRAIHFLTLTAITALALPLLASAQITAPSNFSEAVQLIVKIVRGIIGILFASLAVGLLYGVVQYMFSYDDPKKREEIRPYLLWGVIGIIVVFGMWGLLGILSSTFGWGDVVGIPLLTPPQ